MRLFVTRLALAFTVLFLLMGCASQPISPTEMFDDRPHYPLTVIPISSSLILRHVAGRPCDYNSTARPLIGSMDSARTYSTYELVDANGTQISTAPSMLSDSKYEEEDFRGYDQITVLTSKSKNTILIVEDRSPAIPVKAFVLLRHMPDSSWTWSQFHLPYFHDRVDATPDSGYYPTVVGLSDTKIWFTAKGRGITNGGKPFQPGWSYNTIHRWSEPLDDAKQN